MDLKESNILGDEVDQHWYYQSKAKAVQKMLKQVTPKSILDVGAGSGYFSKYLLTHSSANKAWCIDISYTEESDVILKNTKNIHYRQSIDSSDADLVILMDVLEHVDNDVQLLREYIAKVQSGAYFLISVPAFQLLWSEHDIYLEHKRRYTLNEIEKTASDAGLKIIQGSYYFGAIFPIAASIRLLAKFMPAKKEPTSQLKPHNPIVNQLLLGASSLELPIFKYNRLAGLSAFCLAQKIQL